MLNLPVLLNASVYTDLPYLEMGGNIAMGGSFFLVAEHSHMFLTF